MADYKRPVPKPYSSNNNQEAQFTSLRRQTEPPSRISKHDSYDDGNEIARKLPIIDSGQSQGKEKTRWGWFPHRRPTSPRRAALRRRKPSKKDHYSTKDGVRRARQGSTENPGYDEETDEEPRAPKRGESDDESEEEQLDSINASSSEDDHLSASTPPEGSSSELRMQVRDLQRQIKEKDRQVKRLVRDLSHIQTADGYARDDPHFAHLVRKLRELIKNWSRTQKFQPSPLSSAHRELSIVGSSYKLFLTNPQDIAGLIQAYVWIQLQHHVFNLHRWADPLHDTFQNLENRLRPTSPVSETQHVRFHEWRALTARLIDRKLTDENLTENSSTSKSISHQILGPLRPNDMTGDSKFLDIVKKALELASEIAQQKAELCFPEVDDSSVFDPDTMDDVKEDDLSDWSKVPQKVLLVTAPALVRCGNSSGEDYQIKTPVLKAEVICSLDSIITKSPLFQ